MQQGTTLTVRNGTLAALRGSIAAVAIAAAALWTTTAAIAQNLVIAGVSAPTSLDPDVWTPGTIETMVNVYEGLVQYGYTEGPDGERIINPTDIKPLLAESWTSNEAQTEYVFKLRSDVVSPYGNKLRARAGRRLVVEPRRRAQADRRIPAQDGRSD